MKGRGVAVVLAFVLAAAATLGVFLYVRGVKQDNNNKAQELTTVVVSKQDIAAGTKLDPLISQGGFTTLQVPNDAIVQGAVTDLTQLQNRTTNSFILQNEQISTTRLQGSSEQTGGKLGIPAGDEALTIQLEAQRVLNGQIQTADHVVLYATGTPTVGGSAPINPSAGGAKTPKGFFPGATMTLVPDVLVLQVLNPSAEGLNTGGNTFVTLALKPHDAAAVIAAQAQGLLWLSLLPPGQHGAQQAPVFIGG
jgi:Flp pilus assembly protein CpaB